VIETEKNFYQILTGTDDDLLGKYADDMETMITSFREL
jgi:hypothetical protein